MLHRNQKFASALLILALFALTGCAQPLARLTRAVLPVP